VICGFFLGIVVVYDHGCGGVVFFGNHPCPMDSFYGGLLVRWMVISTPIQLEDFASLDEPKVKSWLCGKLYWACEG
jgi:hypothetical protein